jgi:hypothetical protein
MGMDLSGAGGYFRWTNLGWGEILVLGKDFGWEPNGTGPPRGCKKAEWVGTYYSNDGQLFYARDARLLAEALERALDAMSEEKSLSTDQESAIREFIEFCKAGSFRLF